MVIRCETTVMFHVPDEAEEFERFLNENDINQWRDHSTSEYWIYTHKIERISKRSDNE